MTRWLSLLLLSQASFASMINVETILENVETQFPKMLMQREKVKASLGKLQKSRGAFDVTLKGNYKNYLEGYYDAELSEVALNKPIGFANSELSIGQKKGTGLIPVYLQEYATDQDGEFFLRFNLSLSRYREIDNRRFNLWVNKNNVAIEKYKTALKLIDVKISVNQTYWSWFYYYQKKSVYEELLKLNKNRFKAIKKRVASNDLARIYLTESELYILKFQNQLVAINSELDQYFAKLKLYYPKLRKDMQPVIAIEDKFAYEPSAYTPMRAIKIRPELKIIDLLRVNNNFDIKLAEQKNKPKIDIIAERFEAQDRKSPYVDESIIGIKFDIPIERDLGNGDIARARSENKVLVAQQELIKREIIAQVSNLNTRIQADLDSIKITKKEVRNAKKLQKAEWTKFRSGASDFFLINNRDMKYAESKLYLMEKYVDFQVSNFTLKQWFNPVVPK